jgi:tetratricopeptide (TPR) repeat protein
MSAEALARAESLRRGGDAAQAERLCRQELAADPHNADALNLLALLRLDQGRPAEALGLVATALRSSSRSDVLHCTHGQVLVALGRHEEALASFGHAIALAPAPVEALHRRARALSALGRDAEALDDLDRLLGLDPDHVDALNDRGILLRRLHRPEAALASYERALAIAPHFAEALNNRGAVLLDLRRHEDALASFAAAQALRPDYADAHRNEALARLMLGDFAGGWAKYEWRWKDRDDWAPLPLPVWDGRVSLAGKTLLLHAEQGLGDTIQFARYVPALAARGARVVLGVGPALKPLLGGLEGVAAIVSEGDPLPAVDLQYPMASLPLAFATDLAGIPQSVPYLKADPGRVAHWRERLPGEAPRIGLVWSGSRAHVNDHNRSLRLRQLAPILGRGEVCFVGLQQDIRDIDAPDVAAAPMLGLGRAFRDFSDTAAVVSQLDLVISVDTSVAHLAGALACRLWVLLPFVPDWRWLLEREDSPWYPTARLFRQPKPGDWASVIERLDVELACFALRRG